MALSVHPMASAVSLDPGAVPSRTQITVRLDSGVAFSTLNGAESRPALSLAKLYLGYWVLYHGAPEDQARVENMIRYSEDSTATYLDRKYRQAIPAIIGEWNLYETHYSGYWGGMTTSTEDVARFTSAIQYDPVATPIMNGMREAAPIARDGYAQNYGTSRLPGVWGTKFGWSDNRTINASVSLAQGFTVAAHTYGTPDTLTDDVLTAVHNDPQPSQSSQLPTMSADLVSPEQALLNASREADRIHQQVAAQADQATRNVQAQFAEAQRVATEQAATAQRDTCNALNSAASQEGLAPVC